MNGPTFAPVAAPATKAAPPRTPPPPRPAVKPDPDAGNSLRILTYLRLHWLMIAFCGTLLGAIASYAAWELMPSKFESYSLLQVSSVPTSLANQNNPNQARTDFATYVKTTSALIKSEFVLNAALRELKDLPTIKNQKEPLKYLDEEVSVSWQDGSEVVRIIHKGSNPTDVKKIVDSVQNAFLKEVVQKETTEKGAFLRKVEDARDAMQAMLDKRSKKPEKGNGPALAGGVVPPGGVQQAGGVPAPPAQLPAGGLTPPGVPQLPANAAEMLFARDPKLIVGKYARLLEECEKYPLEIQLGRKRLQELDAKLNALKTGPVNPLTMEAVEKDQDVLTQSLRVKQARRAYDFALASSGNNDSVSGVRNLKQTWEAQEARLKEIRDEKARLIEGSRRIEEAKKLVADRELIVHQLERLEAQLNEAKAGLEKFGKQLVDLPVSPDKGFGLPERAGSQYLPEQTDLMTLDGIYSRLVAQHQMIKYELDSPPRVRALQPASTPMQKDIRKQILGTVFAGLMGYAILAAGVIGFETLGRRVSSLADLKSAGPAPVVGVIPCRPTEAAGRDPVKRAAAHEALDKLRTYVAQTWLSRGATTIAVTSPLGDEGKAFTAFGLASSLAQSGYKTLAIDFDLREPALHAYAGVLNQNGVCEVLRGEVDTRSAVQSLPNGLDLIPAGKWSDEARKAAVGGRLETLLLRLKEPYDAVVIHGHALLTAAEAVEVARRCEVVLVCALYRETKVPLLRKATDRVATLEIPYSGVVYVGATEQESLC